MAERIEDHRQVEAAEFEAEQPARDLSGLPKLIISAAAWRWCPGSPGGAAVRRR